MVREEKPLGFDSKQWILFLYPDVITFLITYYGLIGDLMKEILITDGQKMALQILLKKCGAKKGFIVRILSILLDKKVGWEVFTADYQFLLESDWQKIRDEAYPGWRNYNWVISDIFKYKINLIVDDLLGQKKLF